MIVCMYDSIKSTGRKRCAWVQRSVVVVDLEHRESSVDGRSIKPRLCRPLPWNVFDLFAAGNAGTYQVCT
jgi:hypothetical protein